LASTDPYSMGRRQHRPNIPIVLFDRIPPGHQGPAVVVDNNSAAYEATKYLISLGHRKIAFISGRLDLSTGMDRAEGFRKAMEDAHLPVRADYLKRGDFKAGSGYEAGLELLRLKEPPTAIFSSNSGMTLGLLKSMRELGARCPEDVSVFGFDDLVPGTEGFSFGALLKPELTVIAQPGYEIGRRAAQMLLKMLTETPDGSSPPDEGVVTLKAELCIRNSVMPPVSSVQQ